MALNITYERSPLADLMADLPKLLLQYKMTLASWEREESIRREERVWKEKVTQDAREYEAAVSMYQDAKVEERDARLGYEKVEDLWRESGLGLQSLNEMFKTDQSLKVLEDINKIPADDYRQREQFFSDKAYNLERKADILENILYGDIRRAQNVMAGGAGYIGGTKPLYWDVGDLSLEAYKKLYGESSEVVKEYFKANPAAIRTALAKLEQGQLDIELLREKTGYYKQLGVAQVDKAKFQRKERIGKYFASGLAIGEERSGLSDYNVQNSQLAEMMSDEEAYGEEAIDKKRGMVIDIRDAIGTKFGRLKGDKNLTDSEKSAYFKEYQEIHRLSRSKTATHLGVISDPDFVPYWDAIERAYATFNQEEEPAVKAAIEQAAKELFGFHEPFDEFVGRVLEFKTDYVLAPFVVEGQIDDPNVDPVVDSEEQEWQDILGED